MVIYKTKPVVVRDLFDNETVATINRFMDNWLPTMPLSSDKHLPDSKTKFNRRYANDIPFFVNIHHQLTGYASDLFGEKVKPSYSFLSLYEKEGRCPLHIDRPQCRYTIDYLVRQEQTNPWPICIGPQMTDKDLETIEVKHPENDDEFHNVVSSVDWTTAMLNPNDAVCYSGTHAWHYRPEPSSGKIDLVFFHFVPEAFRGPLK